jgi:hypothetical protein
MLIHSINHKLGNSKRHNRTKALLVFTTLRTQRQEMTGYSLRSAVNHGLHGGRMAVRRALRRGVPSHILHQHLEILSFVKHQTIAWGRGGCGCTLLEITCGWLLPAH